MSKLGDLIGFTVVFTNSSGTAVDPTTVSFYLREEVDGTELEWLFTPPATATTTPTGMNAVARDSAGNFHVNFLARKPERITAYWKANGGTATTTTQNLSTVLVRHAGINLVEP